MKIKQIGSLAKTSKRDNPNQYRVYDPRGLSRTLVGNAGGTGGKTGLYAIKTGK